MSELELKHYLLARLGGDKDKAAEIWGGLFAPAEEGGAPPLPPTQARLDQFLNIWVKTITLSIVFGGARGGFELATTVPDWAVVVAYEGLKEAAKRIDPTATPSAPPAATNMSQNAGDRWEKVLGVVVSHDGKEQTTKIITESYLKFGLVVYPECLGYDLCPKELGTHDRVALKARVGLGRNGKPRVFEITSA